MMKTRSTMNKMFQSIFKWNELKKSTTFRVAMVCTSNTGKIRAHNEDNFSFAGIDGINIEVPVTITEAGAVSGQASDVPVILGITAEVTISGTIVDGNADLKIDVSAPLAPESEPIKMAVTFKGTKQ